MPILFAIIFLAVVFKGVGLLLGMCGRLLGAEPGRIYPFIGSRNAGVWIVGGIFSGAVGNCWSVAGGETFAVNVE